MRSPNVSPSIPLPLKKLGVENEELGIKSITPNPSLLIPHSFISVSEQNYGTVLMDG